jgi:molybdopterin converting factor small subunit
MNVLLFGPLADTAGTHQLQIDALPDTDQLIRQLQVHCPALRGKAYTIAVNQEIIRSNTVLSPDAEIALLPQYSGG